MRRNSRCVAVVASVTLCATFLWMSPPAGRRMDTYLGRSSDGTYTGIAFRPGYVALLRSRPASPFSFDPERPGPASHRFVHTRSSISGAFPPGGSLWNQIGFYYWPNDAMLVLANNEQITYRQWM